MKKLKTSQTAKPLAFIALCSAIICIVAPWSIAIGVVPISLATFAVYIISALTGWKYGTLATIVYILIGAIGIPVFSSFKGGISVVFGATGGFIIGYAICAFIVGFLCDKIDNIYIIPLSMAIGNLVIYIVGATWFSAITKTRFLISFSACALPFIIVDAIKILISTFVVAFAKNPIKRLLKSNY